MTSLKLISIFIKLWGIDLLQGQDRLIEINSIDQDRWFKCLLFLTILHLLQATLFRRFIHRNLPGSVLNKDKYQLWAGSTDWLIKEINGKREEVVAEVDLSPDTNTNWTDRERLWCIVKTFQWISKSWDLRVLWMNLLTERSELLQKI